MDWTKAKSILIVALIVTNLVLVGAYYFQNHSLDNNEDEMQAVTVKLLEDKNIFLQTNIPQNHARMPKLTVQFDTMKQDVIDEQLANQTVLSEKDQTDEKLIAKTSEFIINCGLMTDNVTFDNIERANNEIKVTYKNYIDGIAIEDSYIICTLKDGKITDFKRYWLNPIEVSDIKKGVIPAVAALIKFMSENTEAEKVYVEKISMVYWLDSESFDAESPVTDTAFPAWKITYNHGKVKHILAWEQ